MLRLVRHSGSNPFPTEPKNLSKKKHLFHEILSAQNSMKTVAFLRHGKFSMVGPRCRESEGASLVLEEEFPEGKVNVLYLFISRRGPSHSVCVRIHIIPCCPLYQFMFDVYSRVVYILYFYIGVRETEVRSGLQ